MKTRSKITAAITAILLIAVAAGCKHNALGTLDDLETRKPEVDVYATVKGTIENYAEIIHETVTQNNKKPAERTIAPDIVKSGYKFFIYGEMGTSFTGPFQITDDMLGGDKDAEKQGNFEVTLKKGEWNLTLVAFGADQFTADSTPFSGNAALPSKDECKTGFAGKAMLISKAYVDLSKGDTSDVKFTLSPEGLSGTGQVNFFMVLDGWTLPDEIKYTGADKNLKVTGSIKNLKTNALVTDTDKELEVKEAGDPADNEKKVTTTDGVVLAKDTQYLNYTLAEKKLDPGTYIFILEFENTETKKKWTWNDEIMIFPKDKTDETQYLQEIIMKSPKAPEWLFASVETDTKTPYVPKTNRFDASGDYYQVTFQWADWALSADSTPKPEDITNETHFELQIGDITDIEDTVEHKAALWKHTAAKAAVPADPEAGTPGTPAEPEKDETTYTDSKNKPQNGNVMIFNQGAPSNLYYVDGSMLANNTKLTVNLELGKQYTARIRAVNDTGASDWTYVTLKNNTEMKDFFPTKIATEKAHITLSGEYFKGSTINNYRVRYYLNGGEIIKADGTKELTGDYVDYYGPVIVNTSPEEIGHKFVDFYKNGAGLKNGDILITGWKKGSSSNAAYYPVSEADQNESKPTSKKSTYATITGYGDYTAKMQGTTTQDNGNGVVVSRTRWYLTKSESAPSTDGDMDTSQWKALTTGQYSNVETSKASSTNMILYEGYDNLALWAQYPAKFDWEIVTINDLKPAMIRYQVVTDTAGTEVEATKIPKYIAEDGTEKECPEYTNAVAGETPVKGGTVVTVSTNNSVTATYHPVESENFNYIKWTLDSSTVAYRYFRVTIKESDGNDRTIDVQTDITVDGEKNFDVVTDVSDCRKGHYYNVLIEAGLPNSMLSSTIPVVLYVK